MKSVVQAKDLDLEGLRTLVDGYCHDWPFPSRCRGGDSGFDGLKELQKWLKKIASPDEEEEELDPAAIVDKVRVDLARAAVKRLASEPSTGFGGLIEGLGKQLSVIRAQLRSQEVVYIWMGSDNVSTGTRLIQKHFKFCQPRLEAPCIFIVSFFVSF